jgi:hypothetical protein
MLASAAAVVTSSGVLSSWTLRLSSSSTALSNSQLPLLLLARIPVMADAAAAAAATSAAALTSSLLLVLTVSPRSVGAAAAGAGAGMPLPEEGGKEATVSMLSWGPSSSRLERSEVLQAALVGAVEAEEAGGRGAAPPLLVLMLARLGGPGSVASHHSS